MNNKRILNNYDRIYSYMLALIPGVGDITIAALLDFFKTPSAVFRAEESELYKVTGLSPQKVKSIIEMGKKEELVHKQITEWEDSGIKAVFINESDYPTSIKQLYDAPFAIYYRGVLPDPLSPAAAIVGSRGCTDYGKNAAFKFGKQLALEDIQIISGMAAGTDLYGHKGALDGDGYTVAVLGCGVDICYPRTNINTFMEIQKNGCIMSEVPPGTKPSPGLFPRRNRLISALSDAVIVIEARERSGSLITADQALEQGKEVFAVPGRIGDPLSEGCLSLIKQGAAPLTDINDILECESIKRKVSTKRKSVFNDKKMKTDDPDLKGNSELNLKVFGILTETPKNINRIMYETGLAFETIAQALLELEMQGMLRCISAGLYVKAPL